MSATFVRRSGLPGAFGALLDETARAAEDFCRVVERFDAARFVAERPGADPNTVSPRAICVHVCGAAHRYADYVRKAMGRPYVERFELDPARIAAPADVRGVLAEMLQYTEETFEGEWAMTEERCRALEFTVRWGPRYDPEMILEHAVCHLLRHRRQLERW